jgi:dienelactone hydrolase
MSYAQPPYNPQQQPFAPPPQQKSKTLLIVLGLIGGFFLLTVLMCCGGVIWFSRFPSVPATASLPFDNSSVAIPAFAPPKQQLDWPGMPAGYQCEELVLGDGTGYGSPGKNGRLWIYKPADSAGQKLPCVLIGPAGSTLMEGMGLAEGDVDEHLPYLHEGFVVIAFSIDGPSVDYGESQSAQQRAYQQFKSANAGLINARNALEYALHQVPEVDPNQIFIAGHSSAGTLALLFAEHEPRLAGCVAFAPCIDLQKRIPGTFVRMLENIMPGLAEFIVQSSPRTHESQLQCPMMLFHAADDSNVPVQQSRDFAERMQAAGKEITYIEVPTGEHYMSMIDEGIPKGIDWMKQQIH